MTLFLQFSLDRLQSRPERRSRQTPVDTDRALSENFMLLSNFKYTLHYWNGLGSLLKH